MKFWRKKTIYTWRCDSCDNEEGLAIIDSELEPTIDLPAGWYAVVSPATPAISIFCSEECMTQHFAGALIVGYA
jgi:hypothetical protein